MFEPIKGLDEGQIEQIRTASEDILENVGFRVSHPEIIRSCRAAGAIVDEGNGIIRFPTPLIREMLAIVPKSYQIANVAGEEKTVGGDSRYGLGIVTDPFIVDYETQQPRRPRLADIRKHTIWCQKNDFIAGMSRMDFPVTDVEGPISSLRALEEFFLHQNKHIHTYVASLESLYQYFDIGDILMQGKPLTGSKLMSVAVAPLTPLGFTDLNAILLLETCKRSFTVVPTVCPMAGTTSPYSLASNLLIGNVENLFLITLSQILNPGNPFLYTFGPSISEMRHAHDLYYTLDKVLWKVASVQIAKSYGLPVAAEAGGTMTYRYDQQNAMEGFLFMLSAYASQANVLAGFGSNYNALGMSGEMQEIHRSWLHAAQFLGQGIRFDGDKLGVKSIKSVGPGGTFLIDDMTLDLLRSDEFFTDDLFDYSGGFAESVPMLERAHDKFEETVRDFTCPLPEKIQGDLKAYFTKEYGKMGGRPVVA